MKIQAAAATRHSPAEAFDFLADLRNHWRLEDRFLELEEIREEHAGDARGGIVRIYGPLRTYRRARTQVVHADPPSETSPGRLAGIAHVGRKTVGRVSWELHPAPTGTANVLLTATVEGASLPDRLLLALGGRRWLRSIFRGAVRNLDRVLDEASPNTAGS